MHTYLNRTSANFFSARVSGDGAEKIKYVNNVSVELTEKNDYINLFYSIFINF